MNRAIGILATLLFLAAGCSRARESSLRAEDPAGGVCAFATTIDEFITLSLADQKSLIASAFERRLQHAANIEYEVVSLVNNHVYHEGHVREVIANIRDAHFHRWVLGRSYRMDIETGPGDISTINTFISSGWDSALGVRRTIIRTVSDGNATVARVDAVEEGHLNRDRYRFWLDGVGGQMGDYIFRSLVETHGHYAVKILEDRGLVQLTVPWALWGTDTQDPLGTRDLLLDPEKGFFPVRIVAHWEQDDLWRTETNTVQRSQLVSDVWMPIKMREVIASSTGDPEVANVFDLEVTHIAQGAVKAADLVVEFPADTTVVDAIRHVSYVIGKDGQPLESKPTLDPNAVDANLVDSDSLLEGFYGKHPPELSITDARGVSKDVKLADFRGKWVLLDFWGLTCQPCIKESLPRLSKFYQEHAADRDRFEILAVCNNWTHDVATIEEFDVRVAPIVAKHWGGQPLPFPVLIDGDEKTFDAYGITAVPMTLLIDPDGVLIKDGDEEMLAEQLLAVKPKRSPSGPNL